MSIPVRCQCGQSFSAKDELAGRTLKCPKCQSPLTIPAPGKAAPVAAKAQPAAARAPAGPQAVPGSQPAAQGYALQPPVPIQTAPTNSVLAELLDDAGMASAHRGEQECPNCRKPMPHGAILCIKCGYHLQHRVKIQGVAQKGGADAHGDAATAALANAAQAIDKDKEDIKKETGEGWPWYAIAAMLLGVIGFIVAMLLLPPQTAFIAAGWSLIVLGGLICVYAWAMVLVNAFKESMLHGLLSFFIGLYWLIYVIIRWDRNGGFFMMYMGGVVVQAAGIGMIGLAPMMKGEDKDAHRFEPKPPPSARTSDFAGTESLRPALALRADRTPVEFV